MGNVKSKGRRGAPAAGAGGGAAGEAHAEQEAELGFTQEEVDGLVAFFEQAGATQNGIEREAFERGLFDMGIENSFICQRIFSVLDRDGDGSITVPEFIRGLDVFMHGTEEELLEFSWRVYDADGDGRVSAEDLLRVTSSSGSSDLMKEMIHKTFEELDSDHDGFISYGDFLWGCRTNRLILSSFAVPSAQDEILGAQ